MFKQTFEAVSAVFSAMDKEIDAAFKEIQMGTDVTFSNNNGHIVITGRVRSVRINNQLVDLTAAAHQDRRDIAD